ncbi:MAG TPA: DUF2066 domain-containing protein [Cellvibrionaceae bacterium]
MSAWAEADQVIDLYSADTLVRTQSEAQRAAGAKRALAEALVRITGMPNAADNPVVRDALNRAQDYIYEYSYLSTDDTIEGPDGEAVAASKLLLKFSAVQVQALLREAGLAFWPANRPSVLVWTVTNTQEGLTRAQDTDMRQHLRQQAAVRGLPVVLPLLDLEDYLALPAESLWQLEQGAIREASERYRASAILVMRSSQTSNDRWRGNWQLIHNEGSVSGDSEADSNEALMAEALNRVADRFAALYAIHPSEGEAGSVVVSVNNVDDFATYKAIERYLTDLALVLRVELSALTDNRLLLRLFTEGDIAQLENTLALDTRLVPASGGSLPNNRFLPRGIAENPLLYQWQGR